MEALIGLVVIAVGLAFVWAMAQQEKRLIRYIDNEVALAVKVLETELRDEMDRGNAELENEIRQSVMLMNTWGVKPDPIARKIPT